MIQEDISMNRTELIAAVAGEANVTREVAEKVVKATFECISAELKEGGKVQLKDFGTFEVSAREAREGRNPRTGEMMSIPAGKVPKFKAGKTLKDAVN